MGYYVTLVESNFTVPAHRVDAARDALKSLNAGNNDLKVGSSEAPHFPWMDADFDQNAEHLGDVLWMLSFEPENLPDGSVDVRLFDSKWSEHIPFFLAALAPFVPDGSYLIFSGEDYGDIWRYVVEGGTLVEYRGEISWVRADAAK